MRPRLRPFIVCCSLFTAAFAASPADFLPPAPPWHGASEALIAKPGNPWITPAEKMGLLDTPNYDETVAWLKKLCAATPLLKLQQFGVTAQGRPLYVVIASKGGAGKSVLLAQAGIHSGEIDGKDAGLMLLRDLAFGGKAALLDKADFVFVPIFNADGHERSSEWNRPNQRGPVHQGWRTTAQNLNLNRDYVKMDTPEMQGMIALLNKWSPSLYLDLHVTDGIDYQYDITYGYHGENGGPAWSPQCARWLDQHLRPAVDAALAAGGHLPGELINTAVDDRDLPQGIFGGGNADPRFSNAYGDLRHLPAILVENHSLKPYPQRVLGTYVLLEAALRTVGENAASLRAAIAADSAARPAVLAANWINADKPDVTKADFAGIAYDTYVSPASGIKEVRWLGTPKVYPALPVMSPKAGVQLSRPKAYWVPVTKPEVIARLKAHGLAMETLAAPRTVAVDMYRLENRRLQPFTTENLFEGRYTFSADVKAEPRTETFPAGSVRISTDQPLGDLAVLLLEPASNDSLCAWGFFNEILQRTEYIEGYVVAPMAEQMLADDPKLKAEFAAKLAADPKFAADPTARLQWFYARSKFYDDRYLLYPVGIER
ncbi:MAG: M14 family metallopeptidase [bacterium]|nr:M14 family metallopeptidase [bacterium]MDI1335397.1 M14 family metallopeptidase [Lacunisphaera sp.]